MIELVKAWQKYETKHYITDHDFEVLTFIKRMEKKINKEYMKRGEGY